MLKPNPVRVFEKTVAEALDWDEDFTDMLESGESITTVSAAAVDTSGTSASTVIGTASFSGTVVTILLQAGTNMTEYRVTLSVTSGSHIYSKVAVLRVRNIPVI